MTEICTQNVRQAAFDLGEFSVDDLVTTLDARTYKEVSQIKGIASRLRREKEIASVTPGLYRYQEKQKPLTKIAKMWRAMKIKGHFTQQDIVKLSGASRSHVKKYVIFLKRAGFITPNTNVSGRGYKGGLYRLMDPDNAPLEHPKSPK